MWTIKNNISRTVVYQPLDFAFLASINDIFRTWRKETWNIRLNIIIHFKPFEIYSSRKNIFRGKLVWFNQWNHISYLELCSRRRCKNLDHMTRQYPNKRRHLSHQLLHKYIYAKWKQRTAKIFTESTNSVSELVNHFHTKTMKKSFNEKAIRLRRRIFNVGRMGR